MTEPHELTAVDARRAILVLFAITLSLNVVALYVVRKYREKYD